jgi:hypothetical protein
MEPLQLQNLLPTNSIESLRILIPKMKEKYSVHLSCSNRLEACILLLLGLNESLCRDEDLMIRYSILKAWTRTVKLLDMYFPLSIVQISVVCSTAQES